MCSSLKLLSKLLLILTDFVYFIDHICTYIPRYCGNAAVGHKKWFLQHSREQKSEHPSKMHSSSEEICAKKVRTPKKNT